MTIRRLSYCTKNKRTPTKKQKNVRQPNKMPPKRNKDDKTEEERDVHISFNATNVKRCFNCGDLDHLAPACTKGIKCFRCNEFGHKGNECQNETKKTLNIQKSKDKDKAPYKHIKINGIDMLSLIDTGSDVNLVTETEFYKIKDGISDYNKDGTICVTGIAKKKINTQGTFTANVQFDNNYADIRFHVVKDNELPGNLIIGNPILKDFKVNFTADGIFIEKIIHLTQSLVETKEYDIDNSQYTEEFKNIIKDRKPDEELKKSNDELRILLTNETPIYQSPRRLPSVDADIVSKPVKEWLEKGIVKPNKSDCASSVVLTYKEDVDVGRLNKKIIKAIQPDRLKDATDLTSLDLKNGFSDVDVRKESQKYKSSETTARLKTAQDEDKDINLLKKIIKTEPYKDYILQNEILHKEHDETRLIVVPKKMQNESIRKNHEKEHFVITKNEELINRVYYRSIGMTPFELLFGTKMRHKDDELSKLIKEENIQKFDERRRELRKKAKESIQKIQKEKRKSYNRKRKKAKSYNIGDLVAIKKTQFTQGSKLLPKYLGPYEIVTTKRNDRYALKKIGNGEGPINTTSSADLMKPWLSVEDDDSSGTDE